MKVAAIILAGGKSSRMGTNKALLTLHGKTNVERIADGLKPHFDDIILVTNNPEPYQFLNVKIVSDYFPEQGPLSGIHAGLTASGCEVNVVVACDMPFVSGEIARDLAGRCGDYDAVVPIINGKIQPLCAVFKKNVSAEIVKCIEHGRLPIKYLLDHLHVHYVMEKDLPVDKSIDLERIFFNMNYPNEYEQAKQWVGEDQGRK